MARFSVALTGGWVVDGSGAPPYRGDIAVDGDHISAIGRIDPADAAEVVAIDGRYALPGFVDTHAHVDALAADPDVAASALHQGVTTMIAGQDGVSFAPAGRETVAAMARYFAAVNGPCPGALADGCTVAEYLDSWTGQAAVNIAYAAPAGTIRAEAMGYLGDPADGAELAQMRGVVARALDEGAVGLSTGLEYVPGSHAGAAEIAALCAPLAVAGGVYISHMRGYEAQAWRGLAEAVDIGRMAGVAVHLSHLHGPANMIVTLVDAARAAGVDLTFDTYPYLRGSTIIAMVALPGALQQAGPDATLEALADPTAREALARDHFPAIAETLPRITISFADHPDWRWTEGLTVPEAARRAGMDAGSLVCELILATGLGAGCVFAQPPTNNDADIRELLRHEAHMGGSDAIYLGSKPHPRGWGTFARFLGRHTRELGDWTWGQAAVHLSGHPARRFGLGDRGLLRHGAVADIVILDPETISDRSTYEDPRAAATGVDHVLIGGRFALRDGTVTADRLGRGLRRSR